MDNKLISPKMVDALVEAATNIAPMGQTAWDAVRCSRGIPNDEILLPARVEDLPLFAGEMAVQVLKHPEMQDYVTTLCRIYLSRLMNGHNDAPMQSSLKKR